MVDEKLMVLFYFFYFSTTKTKQTKKKPANVKSNNLKHFEKNWRTIAQEVTLCRSKI